ncbi:hypothetical protein ABDZ15_21175, partial [Mycobacterium canetti]
GQRIREYTKPLVLILDDFAMREHTAMHADDLYELISVHGGVLTHREVVQNEHERLGVFADALAPGSVGVP